MIHDLCYMYLESMEHFDQRVVILYPYNLSTHKVLIENVKKIPEYIYDYITAMEQYVISNKLSKQAIFDVDKMKYISEVDKQQKKMDELAELLNNNISPYRWNIIKGINQKIDDVTIIADYACLLEKI